MSRTPFLRTIEGVTRHDPTSARPAATRSQLRSNSARARLERKRRQRRRLIPLAAGIITLIVVVAWLGGSRGSQSAAPTTTHPSTTTTTAPPYVPPSVKTSVSPAQNGEGVWTAKDAWLPGAPAVMTTTWRPFSSNPAIVAYGSWIRTSSTLLGLFPGYKGPGATSLNRGPEQVPSVGKPTLLATFNSGFYEEDFAGGFYTNGTTYFPMKSGAATVVQYTNGTVDILPWSGGTTPGSNVIMARQNLAMLVENSQPTAATTNGSAWGITLGGVPAVWRTGLGIDAHGNLIYVAASNLTAATLAQVLIQAGSVRGMQLDINPAWPIFVTYGGSGAVNPSLEVPNPQQTATRFLFSSTKDFFAVFARVPGVVQQPW